MRALDAVRDEVIEANERGFRARWSRTLSRLPVIHIGTRGRTTSIGVRRQGRHPRRFANVAEARNCNHPGRRVFASIWTARTTSDCMRHRSAEHETDE